VKIVIMKRTRNVVTKCTHAPVCHSTRAQSAADAFAIGGTNLCVCVCVCEGDCVSARVRVRMRACVRVHAQASACIFAHACKDVCTITSLPTMPQKGSVSTA
jgi:hypothetical protein